MTLFDYNLLMLKVKENDKNAGEKIDKIYDKNNQNSKLVRCYLLYYQQKI